MPYSFEFLKDFKNFKILLYLGEVRNSSWEIGRYVKQ